MDSLGDPTLTRLPRSLRVVDEWPCTAGFQKRAWLASTSDLAALDRDAQDVKKEIKSIALNEYTTFLALSWGVVGADLPRRREKELELKRLGVFV